MSLEGGVIVRGMCERCQEVDIYGWCLDLSRANGSVLAVIRDPSGEGEPHLLALLAPGSEEDCD